MPRIDELYQALIESPEAERPEAETKLFSSMCRFARSLIWRKLGERNDDLEAAIASAGMEGVARFQGRSKLGTWFYRLTQNHINMELRKRTTKREYFADFEKLFDEDGEELPRNSEQEQLREKRELEAQLLSNVQLDIVREALSGRDREIVDGLKKGYTQEQVAERLGLHVDAVESRIRQIRLKQKKSEGT